jgi:hypothetical protein
MHDRAPGRGPSSGTDGFEGVAPTSSRTIRPPSSQMFSERSADILLERFNRLLDHPGGNQFCPANAAAVDDVFSPISVDCRACRGHLHSATARAGHHKTGKRGRPYSRHGNNSGTMNTARLYASQVNLFAAVREGFPQNARCRVYIAQLHALFLLRCYDNLVPP